MQEGRATRDKAFAEAADGAVVLDSILKVFRRSIEQREWRFRMAGRRWEDLVGFVVEKVRPLNRNDHIMIGYGPSESGSPRCRGDRA